MISLKKICGRVVVVIAGNRFRQARIPNPLPLFFPGGNAFQQLVFWSQTEKKGSVRTPDTALSGVISHHLFLFCKQSGNRGCLGMRKNEDQSNDERVNTKRLDQSQTNQHGNGDLT